MNAHIFTPQDDSLPARVQAYQRVVRDYQAFFDNCSRLSDEQLGEPLDLAQAKQVFLRSLEVAKQSINDQEFSHAIEQGLLTNDDLRSIVQTHRNAEIEAKRDSQQSSHTRQHQNR